VRAEGNPSALASAVRSVVGELDSSVPIYAMQPMSDLVADALVRPRFLSMLLAAFSAIALLLAAVGIYGMMSYSVAQRTQEIGIRMALGARRPDVIRLVLGQGLMLLGVGTIIGLVGAFALTRFIASLLYEVAPTDLLTYAGVVGLLGAVALLASYIPARRAAKVDPMVALRYE
jgi:putative ABC transport system permease protein